MKFLDNEYIDRMYLLLNIEKTILTQSMTSFVELI